MKMFGLAALAAVSAMAFMGVSSASATNTVLCTKHLSLTCAVGDQYTGHVEAVASGALLTASFAHVECETSSILGTALGLANPLVIHTSELSFEGCGEDTVDVVDESGLILILKTALNKGTGSAHGFKVLVESSGLHCEYGGVISEGLTGEGSTKSSLAQVVANEAELTKVGGNFFCPSKSQWTATYEIQLPHTVYLLE
jgi:hypothetical protein